jgi:hypothetical protein
MQTSQINFCRWLLSLAHHDKPAHRLFAIEVYVLLVFFARSIVNYSLIRFFILTSQFNLHNTAFRCTWNDFICQLGSLICTIKDPDLDLFFMILQVMGRILSRNEDRGDSELDEEDDQRPAVVQVDQPPGEHDYGPGPSVLVQV